jgi:multidrug efflux pump subunit AcrB
MATAPAVVAGVALMLMATGTTLNIQSFMGAIMAIGVAMANAILVITFSEQQRRDCAQTKGQESGVRSPESWATNATTAAIEGAEQRLRPILMTSAAMVAGMLPLALALGEGGQQTAPLGRAVIGGLAMATAATLFVLPCVFALVQSRAKAISVSLDPDDPQSAHFAPVTSP